MTTIAYDTQLGQVAADSQETSDSGHKFQCKKIFKVNDFIIATAGGSYAGMAFIRWMKQWENDPDWEDVPDFTNLDFEEDFECLVIREDGSCFTVNRLFVPLEQTGNRYISLGSGAKAATAAMMAGATPKEAVEIAKKVDTYTGGKVVSLLLD